MHDRIPQKQNGSSTIRRTDRLTPRQFVYITVVLAIVFHGALLPFSVENTYDAQIHMFFGDHYNRSWFDPWEPRWYTGFSVTAYPPGGHQLIGLLLHLFDHKTSFILVQLAAVTLLTIGIYRFSKLWVPDSAAAAAAMIYVFSTSLSQTLHIFGQLPTTLSIGLFLNATPHLFNWIERGSWRDVIPALAFTVGATAAHHVTPIFATLLFVAPLGVRAWLNAANTGVRHTEGSRSSQLLRIAMPPLRGVGIGVCMLTLIIAVVMPYWYWSITDPINQVSIPHGSRESFIARPDMGLMFFIIPWGLLIAVLPFVIWKTLTSNLWPLGASILAASVLGTGGTTPIPEVILRGAFWILTLDRFTFWATIMVSPFAGLLAESIRNGQVAATLQASFSEFPTRLSVTLGVLAYGLAACAVAVLPLFRPTQPEPIDPAPLVAFMSEDNHNQWRYITLGFGDQFAMHSALIDAESVDGNYHSARRLPSFTSYSVERLENSKYLGVPGLASLNQFLTNADRFSLKFVFSVDEFYDPLLFSTGWNPIVRLRNGVVIWEKPDVSPLPFERSRPAISRIHSVYWGIVPPAAILLALLAIFYLAARQELLTKPPSASAMQSRYGRYATRLRDGDKVKLVRIVAASTGALAVFVSILGYRSLNAAPSPEQVVAAYYEALDFRAFERAWELLDEEEREPFGVFMRRQRITGGLLASYAKLDGLKVNIISRSEDEVTADVDLRFITAIDTIETEHQLRLRKRDGDWAITPEPVQKQMRDYPLSSGATLQYAVLNDSKIYPARRSIIEASRPAVAIEEVSLVQKRDRFFVLGRLNNRSALPSCYRISADAHGLDGETIATQFMGSAGAHRLLPGSIEAFRIDIEGYLKISDADMHASYDPHYFSVPEFSSPPESASVTAWSTVCNAAAKQPELELTVNAIKPTQTGLSLDVAVENLDQAPVNIITARVSIFDEQRRLIWVEFVSLKASIVPGETRGETWEVSLEDVTLISSPERVSINGESGDITGGRRPGGPGWLSIEGVEGVSAIEIDLSAMPYLPLQ